ncbi:MAG: hypothetical protein IKL32_05215, partial [Alphaproteobacteria bacterium]|nr:hypothetical protein [Alphaproteobacteria bacterium]
RQSCECNAFLAKSVFTEDEYKDLINAMKENANSPRLVSFFGSMSKEKSERYYFGLKACISEFAPIKSFIALNVQSCKEKGRTLEECFCFEMGLAKIVGDKNYRELRIGDIEEEIGHYSDETILRIYKMMRSCRY